jgi:Conserved hypothetical protein 2217 (DUF2460)
MLTFPSLKSGAVMQYPARKTTAFKNQVLSFLDGGEQRYRLTSGPLHQWVVQLDLLEDAELNALEIFLRDTEGAFAEFSFNDPKDGKTYPNCYLKSDSLESVRAGGLRGNTTLLVCENRTP